MRHGILHRRSRWRHSKPLVVRGGLARTFGGLASFLAVIFLCGGIYILEDAFANPVAAQAVAVFVAALSIALAAILFFYLLKPASRPRLSSEQDMKKSPPAEVPHPLGENSPAAAEEDSRRDLAYQRIYVDHSLIPPRVHI